MKRISLTYCFIAFLKSRVFSSVLLQRSISSKQAGRQEVRQKEYGLKVTTTSEEYLYKTFIKPAYQFSKLVCITPSGITQFKKRINLSHEVRKSLAQFACQFEDARRQPMHGVDKDKKIFHWCCLSDWCLKLFIHTGLSNKVQMFAILYL